MSLPRVPRSRPRPKLRSIPRRKTESALYAEMQQLTVERQRLYQELESIRERQGQIHTRLQEIDQAMQNLKQNAESFADPTDPKAETVPTPGLSSTKPQSSRFLPMTLDY